MNKSCVWSVWSWGRSVNPFRVQESISFSCGGELFEAFSSWCWFWWLLICCSGGFSQCIGFMLRSRGSIVVLSVTIIKSARIGQQEEAAVLAWMLILVFDSVFLFILSADKGLRRQQIVRANFNKEKMLLFVRAE